LDIKDEKKISDKDLEKILNFDVEEKGFIEIGKKPKKNSKLNNKAKSVLDMFNQGFRFKYFHYGDEKTNMTSFIKNKRYWKTKLMR